MARLVLCLAHYCDVHGPTPLMVTEGIPVDCNQCSDGDLDSGLDAFFLGSVATSAAAPPASGRASAARPSGGPPSSSAAAVAAATADAPPPPHSPRRVASNAPQGSRRDSGFGKTYNEFVQQRAIPCENCAMTLPERQGGGGGGGLASPPPPLRPDNDDMRARGPTLRTRAPYAKVYGGAVQTPPPSQSSQSSQPSAGSDTGAEAEAEDRRDATPSRGHQNNTTNNNNNNKDPRATDRNDSGSSTRTASPPLSSTSPSASPSASPSSTSTSCSAATTHTHYLNYTSTHQPINPESWRLVRNSCLRTLSFEILPRAPAATASTTAAGAFSGNSPQSPTVPSSVASPFVTTQSSGAAVSGGSIFFGDSLAGYTTAYIFRIPDVHARGHKRVYAFMAISTHPESATVKTFAYVTSVFQELAQWIQRCAEHEAETARDANPAAPPHWQQQQGFLPPMAVPHHHHQNQYQHQYRQHDPASTRRGSVSSGFLSSGSGLGLTRRMGGGGGGFAPKARGLADLVGLPDIFIQLHRRFVPILFELSMKLSS